MSPSPLRWIWSIGVVGVALLSACESPGLMEGRYSCSPTDPSSCPAGWHCVLSDGVGELRCYSDPVIACGDGGCECGNGECEAGEDSVACPADCYCGNGTCDGGEDSASCESDCTTCGDGVCGISESGSSCPADCATTCGDGTCQPTESHSACPQDCTCGNGICEAEESIVACGVDCYCGNGTCDSGEDPASCAADCVGSYCGDGTCDAGEDASSCPADCDIGCTDIVCDLYPQCGCTGGQKCTLDSANNKACMSAGATPAGGECSTDTECATGTYCIGRSNAGTVGLCLAYCDPTTQAGCTAATSYCLELSSSGVPIDGAGICTLTCQPHNPTSGCPAGFGCAVYTHNITQVTFSDCHGNVGTGTDSSPCDESSGPYCAAGYGCFNDGTENLCYQWCVLGSSCAVGTCDTAVFSPPISLGGTTYGLCR